MRQSMPHAGLCVLLLVSGLFAEPSDAPPHSAEALRTVLRDVEFDRTPAREALQFVSRAAGFNLVVSWKAMQAQGISPDQPITLRLGAARAEAVLRFIANDLAGPRGMIMHIDRHYVRLMTREQANADPVIRIYPVGDLLTEIPDFDDAPDLSLDNVLSDNEDRGNDLFEDLDDDRREGRTSRADRGRALMDVVRNNVEPDLWEANGGLVARMTLYKNNLIVRAPRYVHQQIGLAPAPARRALPWIPAARNDVRGMAERPRQRFAPDFADRSARTDARRPFNRRSNGVSGINVGQRYLE